MWITPPNGEEVFFVEIGKRTKVTLIYVAMAAVFLLLLQTSMAPKIRTIPYS